MAFKGSGRQARVRRVWKGWEADGITAAGRERTDRTSGHEGGEGTDLRPQEHPSPPCPSPRGAPETRGPCPTNFSLSLALFSLLVFNSKLSNFKLLLSE